MEEVRINVRTTKEIKRDIAITARLRGLTMSSLINLLAVRAIREEKQIEPSAFQQRPQAKKVAPHSKSRIAMARNGQNEEQRRKTG